MPSSRRRLSERSIRSDLGIAPYALAGPFSRVGHDALIPPHGPAAPCASPSGGSSLQCAHWRVMREKSLQFPSTGFDIQPSPSSGIRLAGDRRMPPSPAGGRTTGQAPPLQTDEAHKKDPRKQFRGSFSVQDADFPGFQLTAFPASPPGLPGRLKGPLQRRGGDAWQAAAVGASCHLRWPG